VDVIVILDDLATHAKYLREVSLISGAVPGRESYPGDIFYQHAHQIERAGNFNASAGGGSITLFPVLEIDPDRLTDLIPTNTMASTDGHLFFSAQKRAQGYYPSVDIEKSVTRVGRQTQMRAQKELSERLQILLADYETRSVYGRFGAELSGETKRTIRRAMIAVELLKQDAGRFVHRTAQVVLLALTFTAFLDSRTDVFVKRNKTAIVRVVEEAPEFAPILSIVEKNQGLDEVIQEIETHTTILEQACQAA
jgi:F-type H+-transporting ATPase subunit alpha